ncbi:hypothetical protein Hanom_Chr12g01177831 [Helianthus anomalus]
MSSVSRVWMAAGIAVFNEHTDQGYKLRSLINSVRHGKKTTYSDDSLRQVMYMNCWGPS